MEEKKRAEDKAARVDWKIVGYEPEAPLAAGELHSVNLPINSISSPSL